MRCLFVVTPRSDQPCIGQHIMHEFAMHGVERMNIQHCFDLRATAGQCQKLVLVILIQFVGIKQDEFSAGSLNQRHVRADIDHVRNFEITTYVPEIVSQMFDCRAPQKD
jgi:hypothetical protein